MSTHSILRPATLGLAFLLAFGLPLSALVGAAGSHDARIEIAAWDFDADPDCLDAAGWTSIVGRGATGAAGEGGWGLVENLDEDTAPCSWHPTVIHYPIPPNGAAVASPTATTNVDRDLVSPAGEGCLELPADARTPVFEFREKGVLSEKAWITVLARTCPRPDSFTGGPRDGNSVETTLSTTPCGGSWVYVDAAVSPSETPRADFHISECGTEDRELARFGDDLRAGSLDAFTSFTTDLSSMAGRGPFQIVVRLRTISQVAVLPEEECHDPLATFLVGCASAGSPHVLDTFRVTVEA